MEQRKLEQRGRPRKFNEEFALDAALGVFWRNGFQAASLEDLTRAMGINKPSLYATFGNKEQLYLKALERYRNQQLSKHAAAMAAESDLKNAIRMFLRSVATMLTAADLPGGCMVVNSAVICGSTMLPKNISDAISDMFTESALGLLKRRLKKDLKGYALNKSVSVELLADFITTYMSGMAVMAKTGASKKRLFNNIELALEVLPEKVD